MDIIKVMDEPLANKIAAGEVVERPASIVKELIENSIDAGSTTIEITLEEAGLTSIRITDNGKGMTTTDAVRAFERHATSKIDNEHDLFRIRTLGFRGEALASIAAVSKVHLWTSDGVSGTEVDIEGGKVMNHRAASLRQGTDITVSQVFFNTPARLKYMKTIQTELGHTIDLVNRLAISHPDIAFRLAHGQQLLLKTSGSGNLQRVLSDVYGITVAKKMIPFQAENSDYKVSGYVTLPEMTRASKNYMTVLVNGRWVKSYAVNKAVLEALHTYLPIGRFPIIVLRAEADPYLTDVNVHPSKQYIKVSKEGELLAAVREGVHAAVKKAIIVPDAIVKEKKKTITPSVQESFWKHPERRAEPVQSFQTTSNYPPRQQPSWTVGEQSSREDSTIDPDGQAQTVEASETANADEEFVSFGSQEEVAKPLDHSEPKSSFPKLLPVGQVHGTYIVAQNEDGFYMIDQHAAQERIKYEYFRTKIAEVDHEERQMLLMPLIFHYSADEQLKIEERLDALEDVGIFLEQFGPSSYTVKEYPSWFPAAEASSIIEEMIEQVLHTRQVNIAKLREDTAIMMSCKKSIKANHHLTMEDMNRLLDDLGKSENPYTCPHGRPVLIHFTTYELEKMFKRVM
ncbi:DNA mismatch repair endonuclease MutL [Sporosarcina gallistercoris]|uniref:DNA mismatch repair protein MutL n=1 Tax=Sporosarcina gallistercoris TaxID=2762245 RepID=A0ABR8PFV2_9BACL|nr:DNA mismatch repair endonuclease MutL [Sporosarcina gallistercoris]MBD7907054.1 DNA mismatch repair endonuclease MutL [Sporosarcina gallistercoris]